MTHWSEDPTQLAERQAAATVAMEKINEGIKEYLRAIRDEGDAEVLINAVVLFESQGIDAADGKNFWRNSHIVTAFDGSRTQMIGMVNLQTAAILDNLMSPPCEHEYE